MILEHLLFLIGFMITLGVVTKTDGCVETTMDWDELLEVASIGLPKPIVRDEGHTQG